jgi:hypothetical protein
LLLQRLRVHLPTGQICLHFSHLTCNPVQISKQLAELTGTGCLPGQLFERLPHSALFTRKACKRCRLLAGHSFKLLCPTVHALLSSRQPLQTLHEPGHPDSLSTLHHRIERPLHHLGGFVQRSHRGGLSLASRAPVSPL